MVGRHRSTGSGPRRATRRVKLMGAAAVIASVMMLAGCVAPMSSPGSMSTISLVSSTTANGWKYDYYRNVAYPCSVSGYQTFTIATKVGSSLGASTPMWVYMHGGGVGFFNASKVPSDDGAFMHEESAALQRSQLQDNALTRLVAQEPAGFRAVTVSMCNRDLYGGPNIPDPNNPNLAPDGTARTVNGLFATKAAIQFALGAYPTDDYFLYGTSAGAAGTFHVAWALEQQGIRPTGIVADSGVANDLYQRGQVEQDLCGRSEEANTSIPKRLHPDITAAGNDPDQLVTSGRLTVPVVQVWDINDPGPCGNRPMTCLLRDGSSITMGSVDCRHEPMRRAFVAQGSGSTSMSMRMCVDEPLRAGPCDMHTPTQDAEARNTLAGVPADFNPAIVTWVRERLADD